MTLALEEKMKEKTTLDKKIPISYKSSELGVVPIDWVIKPFGEIAEIIMGQSPIGTSYNRNSIGVPLINGPTEFTKKYPIKIQWTSQPTKLCKMGDILLCVRGSSTGRMNISDDVYCIGRGVASIRAKRDADLTFISFQLYSAIQKILALAAGSTFPNIDGKTIRSIGFLFPLLAEQQAIAATLSDIDFLIDSLDQLIAKKRNIKLAAMQLLLTGKQRLPEFNENWKIKRFGDVLKVRHGKSQKEVEVINGKYPILASGGEIGRTNHYLYNKPSVLIGRKGTIDSPRYIENPFWTVDTLFFTEISNYAFPKFIFYKFNMINWRIYSEASGVPSLNASTIEGVEFSTPGCLEEQIAIAEVLTDMDTEIFTIEQQLAKAKNLKQGMMQELLTGRIRLT